MEEELAARKAEDFAAEYLRRIEEGSETDLEQFLSALPEEVRERCRKEIEQLGRLRGMLDTVGSELAGPPPGPMPLPTDPGQPPSLPGFRIDRLLGEGALGTVYAAWDETLERPVALKILKPQPSGRVRESLLSEARKAAALQDPAIVTIHAVTDLDGHPAIVMERVEGYAIDKAATHLTRRQQAELFRSIARGLALAHRRGIIHRDLKPQNILVTPELQPKILDFGLALSSSEKEESGRFVGTPLYASPEQAQGRRLTAASDVFSFGCVMYTILTGRPPFEGKDVNELLHNIAETDPPFPRNLTSDVPKDLQAILRHADFQTTMNHYVKAIPESARKAMESLEQLN